MKIETKIVVGDRIDKRDPARAIVPPIYLSAVYSFEKAEHGAELFAGERDGYIYTRLGNPTVEEFEKKMAMLEGAECGLGFASGMAAISSTILAFCGAGDNVIVSEPIYGGTFALLNKVIPRLGIEVRWAKTSDFANDIEAKGLIDERTKLFLTETPANPTLDLVDLKETAQLAHKHGIPVAVDTTFASFYLQRPIELGVDVVVYSTTKYIGGHSDAVGGVVLSSAEHMRQIKKNTVVDLGGTMSPFSAFIFLRGLQTLAVRIDRMQENAIKIARWLESRPEVERVYYPFLESHPQFELAKRQMSGGSGIITFILKDGRDAGRKFLDKLELLIVAVSLGAVTTLIEHPGSMTHSAYSAENLKKAGIDEGLIRLSVGIENVDDIIEDLERGFEALK
ncbi:MAG TPA: PLP-dependent transferase [candidate division Zixibacteria bacterium]|nr:PLP-dependent transferase [candidate division Zixibacteria bacterium]